MLIKRIGAVVIAVGLVLGALAIRRTVIDPDTGNGGSGPAPEVVRLQCGTELQAVCDDIAEGRDDIEVTVEDPGTTTDRLSALPAGADPGFDAWLAVGPWAAMTADNRQFGGADGAVLEAESPTIGVSHTALAVLRAGEAAVAGCEPAPTWRCVGGLTAEGVTAGMPTPQRGDGLVILASATSSYFEGNSYDSIDLQDTEFQRWFTGLTERSARARSSRQIPLDTAITQPGTYNVVGALTAQIDPHGRSGSAVTAYPDTVIAAPIQVATRTSYSPSDAIDQLGAERIVQALEEHRYDPVRKGETAPPSELPSPGVLQNLRAMWSQ